MTENRFTKVIVPFYLNKQTDSEGRLLREIWEWDNDELESEHDYIQWLFPLSEPTVHNSNAPIVNDSVIEAFAKEPMLRQNMLNSFGLMLKFYGLEMNEIDGKNIAISIADNYEARNKVWLKKYNHNYLRLTRILKSLKLLGLGEYADALHECLREIYEEESDKIGEETYQFWTKAISLARLYFEENILWDAISFGERLRKIFSAKKNAVGFLSHYLAQLEQHLVVISILIAN